MLQEKLTIIEELRSKIGSNGLGYYESEDEAWKLKCKVFKKIEHLNEFIRNEVTPEIHQRYAKEIELLIQRNQ